jgi:hypothetical protein
LAQTLPVPREPVGIAAGHFKGDSELDLAVASFDFFASGGGNVQIFLGAGDGTFTPGNVYDTGGDAWSVAAGDFERNGLVDLAVTNTDGTVAVLSGVGDGTFKPPVYYPTGSGPVDVATADLRGDGTLDLVTANEGADDVSLLRGNGDGTFQPPESILAGANPFFVLVKDLDGDGTLDLVTANSGSASISVILGDGPHSSRPGPGISLVWALQWESANTPSAPTTDRTRDYQMAERAPTEPAQPEKLVLHPQMRARAERADGGTDDTSHQRPARSLTATLYANVGRVVLFPVQDLGPEEPERGFERTRI